jgi:hypothetical protein
LEELPTELFVCERLPASHVPKRTAALRTQLKPYASGAYANYDQQEGPTIDPPHWVFALANSVPRYVLRRKWNPTPNACGPICSVPAAPPC